MYTDMIYLPVDGYPSQ